MSLNLFVYLMGHTWTPAEGTNEPGIPPALRTATARRPHRRVLDPAFGSILLAVTTVAELVAALAAKGAAAECPSCGANDWMGMGTGG